MNLIKRARASLANIIAPKEQRAKIPHLTALEPWRNGLQNYYNWDLERAVRDGYQANPIVFRCVAKKATAASSVPLKVYRKQRDGRLIENPNSPLQTLLDRPNPFHSQKMLRWYMSSHLSLAGNSLLYKVRDGNGQIVELWNIQPTKVRVVPDQESYVLGYKVDFMPGMLRPEDLIHDQLPNPADPYWGLGELQALAQAVDTDTYAQQFQLNSLQNRGVVSGILSMNAPMDEDEFVKAQDLVQQYFIGTENARKLIVLDTTANYNPITQNSVELDLINSRGFGFRQICMGFDIDPILVGFGERATYNNMRWARYTWWHDSIVPWINDMVEQLNKDLTPEFHDDHIIMADYSAVEAFNVDLAERAKTAQTLIATGFNPNEVSIKLKLNLTHDGMLKTVQSAPALERQANTARAIQVREVRIAWRELQTDKRERYEDRFVNVIKKLFADEAKQVRTAFDRDGRQAALNQARASTQTWKAAFEGAYISVFDDFGLSGYQAIQQRDATRLSQDAADLIESIAGVQVSHINETTLEHLRIYFTQAFEAGLPVDDIATGIERLYNLWQEGDVDTSRAYRIARTEIGIISNTAIDYGVRRAATENNLTVRKTWISAGDSRVRDSHSALNGETRAMDERFSNGLLHPCEFGAPAKEVVHCRCVLGYEVQ